MRAKRCTDKIRLGQLAKSEQFLEAAATIAACADDGDDVADAYVTLCVHAGVAASDVVCCARLGEHAQGTSHADAIGLLTRADPSLGSALRTLLSLKTSAGYGHIPASPDDQNRAWRAADALVEAARRAV